MRTKSLLINAILSAAVLCGTVTVAQTPVVNIEKKWHPNLFMAQSLIVKADEWVRLAQKDNRYDLHGHAQQARQLLFQADTELKLAAEDANKNK